MQPKGETEGSGRVHKSLFPGMPASAVEHAGPFRTGPGFVKKFFVFDSAMMPRCFGMRSPHPPPVRSACCEVNTVGEAGVLPHADMAPQRVSRVLKLHAHGGRQQGNWLRAQHHEAFKKDWPCKNHTTR